MSIQPTAETTAVYLAQLNNGRDLAAVRLQRLDREHGHLDTVLGPAAPQTLRALERRDRQQVLVAALQARIDLLEGGS